MRTLTKSQYFFNLHPLMVPAGWTVKENHLYQKPIRDPRRTLFTLENETSGKMVQVEYAGELKYVIRMLNADQTLVSEDSDTPYEQLVERLEDRIRASGGARNLLRLRIPAGWTVVHHSLTDTNPDELAPDSKAWRSDFKRDLLKLRHEEECLLLDIEWYPECSPAGHYALKLIKNGNWNSPLEDMLCIHPKELAYEIHAVLKKTCEHQYVDEAGA
ncbi:hypothetical protein [Bacillus paralicheniformis]|uniref:hypothetical protein n=1 Tax=Bacillus paralicheniformis TaxID=1648923 RepID=UPI002DBC404F|nr:hypothetical protein [Bacillus paralicheniformis]MEC1867775.1 hypothetical protein [Bacillus paralicheniformis]